MHEFPLVTYFKREIVTISFGRRRGISLQKCKGFFAHLKTLVSRLCSNTEVFEVFANGQSIVTQ